MLISRPRPDIFLRFENGDFFPVSLPSTPRKAKKSLPKRYLLQKKNARQSGFLKGHLLVYQPVPGSQIVGKTRKWKALEKGARREKGKFFPPVLFSCSRFLNSADLTISEPGTGYSFTWGQTKTEVVEYDDVIHYIPLALRMVYEGCYRISIIFLWAFASGRVKTIPSATCRRVFCENGGKNLRFQKIAEARGRGSNKQ